MFPALRPLHRLVTDAQAQYEEQMLAHQFRLAETKARRHDLARRLRAAVEDEAPTFFPPLDRTSDADPEKAFRM